MGILSYIPIISDLLKGAEEIASEAIIDEDKKTEVIGKLEEIKQNVDHVVYLAELETKTLPWVDGLHKMARSILNIVTIVAVVVLSLFDVVITPQMALVLGGGNVAYQLIKGKGK